MNLVLVSYLHGFGGAEKQIIMLSNEMAKRKHTVHLISLAADLPCYPISDLVSYTVIKDKGSNSLGIIRNRYLQLRRMLKTIGPDVSINFWYQSAYLMAAMPRSVTRKIVYSERGDPGNMEYAGMLGLVRKLTLPRIDGFVFQSEGARDYFGNRVFERSIVIPNSVSVPNDRYPAPCDNREKRIVSVGRLHPQKNQKLLIDAFAKLAEDFPEYTMEIYGDGELKDTLEKQIADCGLDNRVFLKGSRENILEHIHNASLFVLSSDYEGMPNALMEAMALGVPCVSTDCKPGGVRTLIKDGFNGRIVPTEDAASLAIAMKEILLNPGLARFLGANAIDLRKTHTSERAFDLWEAFLSQ